MILDMTISSQSAAVQSGGRLMIVDDNLEIGAVLEAFFNHHGFITHVFSEGRAALDHARREPVDLAIIDLFMPEIDGFELMRELRNITPRPRVLAMTGGTSHMLKVAQVLGAEGLILKPLEPERLLERVNEVLAMAK
jgi:DNA-binding response OmpR family regulator